MMARFLEKWQHMEYQAGCVECPLPVTAIAIEQTSTAPEGERDTSREPCENCPPSERFPCPTSRVLGRYWPETGEREASLHYKNRHAWRENRAKVIHREHRQALEAELTTLQQRWKKGEELNAQGWPNETAKEKAYETFVAIAKRIAEIVDELGDGMGAGDWAKVQPLGEEGRKAATQ